MSLNSFFIPAVLLLMIITACMSFATPLRANDSEQVHYELALSFDLAKKLLIGTAKITIPPGTSVQFDCSGLVLTGSLLRGENSQEKAILQNKESIDLASNEVTRTLFLSYTKEVSREYMNQVNQKGIALLDHWYPQPEEPVLFEISATLPEDFEAITESDTFPLKKHGSNVHTTFSQPTTTLHFIAGPYVTAKRLVRENLFVYSMFFAEDEDLAASYLDSAAQYLNRYEKEIGPFPYNHYVIVANRYPTGFGMPTFTLLGQMVLRLPFIKNSSLGHEIVHSWFGNSVNVDNSEGNWCEGLTSFLADNAYREDAGEGIDNRKESITKYLSYVNSTNAIPLAQFTSASHNQHNGLSKRTVGYNRGAMLFHELKLRIGEEAFTDGLQLFYRENKNQNATWNDLQASFEHVTQTNLGSFFSERLTSEEIPELDAQDISIDYDANKPVLTMNLLQLSSTSFSIKVPIQVETMSGNQLFIREISDAETTIHLPLETVPLAFTIDPDYAFMRKLSTNELPAVWSRFIGAEKQIVVLQDTDSTSVYQPLLRALGIDEKNITSSKKVTNKELSENSILFIGSDQAAARSLFGKTPQPQSGLVLDVRRNPLNRNHVAALLSFSHPNELTQVAKRLSHYGKYSYLRFSNGKNMLKNIQQTESGLKYPLETLPKGGPTSTLSTFSNVIEELSENQVIYVGENHTSLPDHILQLRIIQALHKTNKHLAIGMEMFPESSQDALDKYTLATGEMDERTFLEKSRYYDVWRYDYRYFRDILNFAKNNNIPVIGLNLDRDIVSQVFRTGSTDILDGKAELDIPANRNLDMPGYAEELSQVHKMHIQGSHASGVESGFIQAQGLWDETMAKNIVSFLNQRPEYKIVVLAGTQHTRKDFGIPPRVASRLKVKQATLLNIYNDSKPANLDSIADYYFLVEPSSLSEPPKIGIVLTTIEDEKESRLKISEMSPHGKAKDAGLQVGDVLQKIDTTQISTMSDLKFAMLDTKAGDIVSIVVTRLNNNKMDEITFQVELTLPPAQMIHP